MKHQHREKWPSCACIDNIKARNCTSAINDITVLESSQGDFSDIYLNWIHGLWIKITFLVGWPDLIVEMPNAASTPIIPLPPQKTNSPYLSVNRAYFFPYQQKRSRHFSPPRSNIELSTTTPLPLPRNCFPLFRRSSVIKQREKRSHISFPFSVADTRFFLFVVELSKI
jgi:hypothetical protein